MIIPMNTAMNIKDFKRLPLDERTNYLWDNGVCLGQRMYANQYIICIFSLNDFFVEARYSKNNNRVDAIMPLTDVMEWEAYVDRVVYQHFHLN